MTARDTYRCYADLARYEHEHCDYRRFLCIRPSRFAIIAPHGGGIEPGTSEIAQLIAGDEFSLYCFEGLKSRRNYPTLHITSDRFDEPMCLELLAHVQTVLAVHGCNVRDEVIYVGGRDTTLKDRIITMIGAIGIAAKEHPNFSGIPSNNICNRGSSGQGVQLEVSLGLRRRMLEHLMYNRRRITPMLEQFAETIRSVLLRTAKEVGG